MFKFFFKRKSLTHSVNGQWLIEKSSALFALTFLVFHIYHDERVIFLIYENKDKGITEYGELMLIKCRKDNKIFSKSLFPYDFLQWTKIMLKSLYVIAKRQ